MLRNSNLQIGAGLNTILLSVVFLFLTGTGYSQTPPEGKIYMGQTPPESRPLLFPLEVKEGYFAAERIAISNDGRDIYYSEILGYYPLRGEIIKRYTFSDGEWTGPFDLFVGFGPALSLTGDTLFFERMETENKSMTFISVKSGSVWSNPKRI